MHTLHYIAVEADSKQEAFDKVVSELKPSEEGYRLASWSDWYVVGGGRFSSNANKENNPMAGYSDDPTDVLGFAEDKDKFQEAITNVQKWKSHAMSKAIKEFNSDSFISDMKNYALKGGRSNSINENRMAYTVKDTATMMLGGWIPNSGLYDLVEYIAETLYLQKRLDKPEQAVRQYLVPVDFHF
jgi:hypothetical protein